MLDLPCTLFSLNTDRLEELMHYLQPRFGTCRLLPERLSSHRMALSQRNTPALCTPVFMSQSSGPHGQGGAVVTLQPASASTCRQDCHCRSRCADQRVVERVNVVGFSIQLVANASVVSCVYLIGAHDCKEQGNICTPRAQPEGKGCA